MTSTQRPTHAMVACMGIYTHDAGSRYIVDNSKLDNAYKYLEEESEFAYKLGFSLGRTVLSANHYEDMWCSCVSPDFAERVKCFMELFCEPLSFALFYCDSLHELTKVWKDEDGVHTVSSPSETFRRIL